MINNKNKLIFVIKTHYISQYHISIWIDLALSSCCDRCVILLNNQADILDRVESLIHGTIKLDIIPFKARDFTALGLPIVPRVPLWRNSWHNGDYGMYYVRSLMPDLQPDDWIVQIDNDVITSIPWSSILPRLPLDSIDFFGTELKKMGEDWLFYDAAKTYYAEKTIWKSLFGAQGYRVGLVDFLFTKRLKMAEVLEVLLRDIGLNLHDLSWQQANDHWPLCEIHVGQEVIKSSCKFIDLSVFFKGSHEHYNPVLKNVNFSIHGKGFDVPLWLHPVKDPSYEAFFANMIPLQEYIENFTSHAIEKNLVRWSSPDTLVLAPNFKGSQPVTKFSSVLKDAHTKASGLSIFGVANLIKHAPVPVVFMADLLDKDDNILQTLSIEVPPNESIPFCFKLTREIYTIVLSSESTSHDAGFQWHFYISHFFVTQPHV